ncbi:MAG: RecX family transcriptional regulator [Clostridiales bacterium]|nr:RecX family transcriptional regulator [Clostridiales bacterium]
MGTITDIAKQKRNPTRVSVFIDGEFVLGLDAVTAVAARIKIGDEITPERLKEVSHKSEVNSAFERAVGYLSASPRATLEIKRYLKDKGYDASVVGEVIERLEQYRYIDDRAYAKSYIKSKSKKYGKIRLSAELRKRGVAADIISELLEDDDFEDEFDGYNGYDEDDGAVETARRYLRTHKSAEVPKLKRFLAGRGFTWDSINAAVRTLSDEGAFTPPDEDYD